MQRNIRFLILMMGCSLGCLDSAAQIFRLPPPDTTSGNYFGASVAIDGPLAIVGSSGDRRCGENAGAAFVFSRQENGEWAETARLEPDNCQEGLFFGKEVTISGNRVAVVAYVPFFAGSASNAVYVFERADTTDVWNQTAKIQQPPGRSEGVFGSSISLDNDRMLITSAGDASQSAVTGAAYVYDFDGRTWNMTARLTGSLGPEAGIFGGSAALDDDRAVVSASTYVAERPGSVYVFDRDPDTDKWEESAILRGIIDFFISVDVDGDRLIVGESRTGSTFRGRARIFERGDDGRWRVGTTLQPSAGNSRGGFGSEVALHGNHALIVGFDEQLRMDINIDRVVYHFEYDSSQSEWYQKPIIDVGNNAFGSAIDLDDGAAVIGQASEEAPGNAFVVLIH